jgi:hypothetical protein
MNIKTDKGWKIARNAPGNYVYSKRHDYFKITTPNALVGG